MEDTSSEKEYVIQTSRVEHKLNKKRCKETVYLHYHSIYTLYIGKLMTEPFFCAMSELWEHSN